MGKLHRATCKRQIAREVDAVVAIAATSSGAVDEGDTIVDRCTIDIDTVVLTASPRAADAAKCRAADCASQVDAVVLLAASAIETATATGQSGDVCADRAGEVDAILIAATAQRSGADEHCIGDEIAAEIEAIIVPRAGAAVDIDPNDGRRSDRACDVDAVVGLRRAATGDICKLQHSAHHRKAADKVDAIIGGAAIPADAVEEGDCRAIGICSANDDAMV